MTRLAFVLLILAVAVATPPKVSAGPAEGAPAAEAGGLAVRCGKLLTMNAQKLVINNAVILVKDGKIDAVGPASEIKIPEGFRVIDGSRRWVLPGLVDFHSHVAGDLGDLNDGVYLTNPDLRTLETLTPENEYVRDARAGGVTSMLLIPGSGNNMAGYGTICKSAGRTAEEIVLAAPGVLKISQAGNPEWYWYGVGRSFMYWNLRTTLEALKAYHDAWCAYEEGRTAERPKFDRIKNECRGLFRREFSALVHTQAYQLMLNTCVQLWDRLGIHTVMGHACFDGYRIGPLMASRGIPIIAGPRSIWLDRHDRRINGIAAKYFEDGVQTLGTNTDAPVLPLEEHFYQATMGVRMGWDDGYDALEGLTIVGAKAGLTEERIGSIEPGKDADIALFNGDPLDPRSACLMTIVNGKVAYDAAAEGQRY